MHKLIKYQTIFKQEKKLNIGSIGKFLLSCQILKKYLREIKKKLV